MTAPTGAPPGRVTITDAPIKISPDPASVTRPQTVDFAAFPDRSTLSITLPRWILYLIPVPLKELARAPERSSPYSLDKTVRDSGEREEAYTKLTPKSFSIRSILALSDSCENAGTEKRMSKSISILFIPSFSVLSRHSDRLHVPSCRRIHRRNGRRGRSCR